MAGLRGVNYYDLRCFAELSKLFTLKYKSVRFNSLVTAQLVSPLKTDAYLTFFMYYIFYYRSAATEVPPKEHGTSPDVAEDLGP